MIIYTALVLAIKNDLEVLRPKKSEKIVFSYRSDVSEHTKLYSGHPSFVDFKNYCKTLAEKNAFKFVAIADIADFYPRIYQHRLENIVISSASTPRTREIARVLVKKFISNIMDKNSYGIPVGPFASRILAESVLVDVDAALQRQKNKICALGR
ncbi:RNA-directed DNA polymerase [Roseococcus thiosulfatophilus]|uniref:RNA-directed DNA polymerase n=1 Tax=Roseococcus thiosulfatophilus TaxID=35813 RepID=UPI001A8F0BF1|nr:RNA-directed DNA polymerase [Roseococcus thiosulfatophilus]